MWCLKGFYEGLKGLNFNTTLEMHGTGRVKLNQFMQYESHGVKSVQVRIYSGPYFPEFGLNTGKYGPEITPYLDTFHIVSWTFTNIFCDVIGVYNFRENY